MLGRSAASAASAATSATACAHAAGTSAGLLVVDQVSDTEYCDDGHDCYYDDVC